MSEQKELLTTNRKALTINLDPMVYGTFAEIGAGQEVARMFFQAGGASGTVAKTISAYDMTFSDAIYGKAPRYVSRERLSLMLDHEYELLLERLSAQRGKRTQFFVFADTVATRNFQGSNEAHGWMGVRFQAEPEGPPSEILLHVRMWDRENILQQQALGIIGVNVLYGAFNYRDDPCRFIDSLLDNLSTERIEVDMLRFSGPAFTGVDNRLMALHLVECGLTNAVMFSPAGEMLQPSEALHKKAILVERGSFRPVTLVNLDMLRCAETQLKREPAVAGKEVVVLMEITVNNLLASGKLDPLDFLARVDLLGELGLTVLISNHLEYHRLTAYFRRYTKEMVGVAMGINNLRELFNPKWSEKLPGGILESFGRLFRHAVKLYIYPMRADTYRRYIETRGIAPGAGLPESGVIDVGNMPMPGDLRHLYAHLVQNQNIGAITGYDPAVMSILADDVRRRIKQQDSTWAAMVPPTVAESIRQRGLFGYTPAAR
jgi:hypothetical protein